MLALYNIHSVARYESKLLMRSWFYRIFLILALLLLCLFNFIALISEDSGGFWLMKALPANIPYINLMFLNTGQAIVAVFLSSEFLKADKKLDTSEVFYVHPLSNAEYVAGKILGNLSVFIRLDLLVILLVVIFNIVSGVTIDWKAYLTYFLLICIPTLIYIFGLSVALMLVLKSQAITFVFLLGYIALTLFYIGDKFYYLFDYMVYNLPLVKSTIVGFSNWSTLINHRMIYLLFGLGFLSISIFLFRRLPNSTKGKYRWLWISFLFFAGGIWASFNHVEGILNAANRRQLYTEVNNRYVGNPRMVVDRYDINLIQHPGKISSEVEIRGVALNRAAEFTFCLNPALVVSEVAEGDQPLNFKRDHQILQIDFGRELAAGDSVSFKLKYSGTIDENFCYLDIPDEILLEERANGMFKIDKRYSFQGKNYLLFTPETYWYPRPGTSYSSENPDWQQAYFSHFRLKVKTINGLKALSQGTMKWPVARRIPVEPRRDSLRMERRSVRRPGMGADTTANRPMRPRGEMRAGGEMRPQRERPAGEARMGGERRPPAFEGTPGARERGMPRRRSDSDSLSMPRDRFPSPGRGNPTGRGNMAFRTEVTYDSLFVYETDFPTPSITLIIGDYEQKSVEVDETLYSVWYLKGHDYFSDVLAPITDTIPAMIRERRRSIEVNYALDYSFNRFSLVEVPVQFHSYMRTWTQAQEVMQPEMVLFPEKGSLLNEADVVKGVRDEKRRAQRNGQEISDEDAGMRVFNRFLRLFERQESAPDWSQQRGAVNVSTKPNPYFIFPQLYNFRYNIFSSEWPVSNRLIELYLQDRSDVNNWIRQTNGISNNEKANLLMAQYPFRELLTDVEHRDLLDNVISLKANYLFAHAERNVGYKEFRDSLRALLKRNLFTNLRFENLLDTLGAIGDADLHTPLKAWHHPTALPVYLIWTPEVIQITNRDAEVFVVKLQITNDSDQDGVVNVEINFGGGQGAIYDPRAKRKVPIKAHETKSLVSVWEEAPRSIQVNTLISANLPATIMLPVTNIIRERNKTVDEEGDFIVENASFIFPGEVIVDNEDSTLFSLSAPEVVGLLPQWLDRMEDDSFPYSGVSNWRPPLRWTLTTNDKYYGTHIRSAYVVRSGSGTQTATWRIPVPESGQYDLYYWVYKPDELRRGRGRGGRRAAGRDAEYHFKIRYDGSEEDGYINLQRSEEGWSLLGSYFFSKDTVDVVLSCDTKLRTVTADAVKIVRRH
jgi:ABC-type transport system involved in multi-copper enzyme maturation permease subunit